LFVGLFSWALARTVAQIVLRENIQQAQSAYAAKR
jgi:hypothetical protein